MSVRPRKIIHVITGLGLGGAEAMLTRIVTIKPALADETIIVSLLPGGKYIDVLRAFGIPVVALEFKRIVGAIAGMFRLARLIAAERPDIVQGWMYHGDLAALLALFLSGRRKRTALIWNIRCSDIDLSHNVVLRMVVRACVLLSRFPDLVMANSVSGLKWHRAIGYRPRRATIVFNGIDVGLFKPDMGARREIRRELGIADDAFVLAHVARVDPMKEHADFFAAMRKLSDIYALVVGAGTERLPGAPNLHRLGARTDVARLYVAADVVVSSSAFGEGFSNAIAEGMACGLPAVATDVGDARTIVGDTGLIVPPRDSDKLAAAIRTLASESPDRRIERARRARIRIVENFSLERARGRFEEIYAAIATAAYTAETTPST